MKKLISLIIVLLVASCVPKKVLLDKSIITQKQIDLEGFQLVLKNVYNDSRCPEGVNCVWAGDVTVVIEVYENNKFIEDKTMVFSSKNTKEIIDWVAKYYTEKPIKSVQVLPYPKDGISNELKDYYLKIEY